MRTILKSLKPFTALILLAIVLLFGQAMADLSLPGFMSDIVNVGIQTGGVEEAIPEVISQEQYQIMTYFFTSEEEETLGRLYEQVQADQVADRYPNLEGKVYQLLHKEDGKAKEELLAKGMLISSYVLTDQGMSQGADPLVVLEMMPKEQRMLLREQIEEQFTTMGEDMVYQAGAAAVKGAYEGYGRDMDKVQRTYILKTGGIMLLVTLAGALASIAVGFLASRTAAGVGRNLRAAVFNKVLTFSKADLDTFSTATLITRATNDVTQIQNLLVIMIRMVFYAPIMGVGGVILANSKNTSMSWIIAVAVGALLLLVSIIFTVAVPKFKLMQKLVDKVNLVMREQLSGMMVIRAFTTERFEEERFDEANQNLTATNLFVSRVMVLLFPLMMLIMNGVSILIIWVGAHEIANANMQVGDMMAFMQYAMQIIFAFLMLSMMFILIPRALVSAGRIGEVLSTEASIRDPETPKELTEPKGKLVFEQVYYQFEGAEEPMLKDISFTAEPGQVTAIIGSTGSGKSTLLNMIPRFYDATDGKITVDGVDVRDLSQHQLRDMIGYVPQKALLFSGDVRENLTYGKEEATKEACDEAITIAQASDFVLQHPQGYDQEVAQGGQNLSGGQKQRLSIARAIIKKPKLYLFDDSFSALDYATERTLRRELMAQTSEATVLIVGQRIASIKSADQIIVLEDGYMVGKGSHEDLMRTCKTYQEIAYSQLSKEELA